MKQLTNEQLLEHCLQEVARTGDIEAVLRRYPQYASQLRPLLEMAMTVGCYYATVPEPPSGLAAGRARLIATAAQQRARAQAITIRKERIQPKMKLFLVTRLVSAILAVVIGTAAVGGGVVWAASDSLPGDFIYPVKLTVENLRMDLARTPEAQVDLALQFAEERVAEIQAMVETGLPVSEQVTTRMEQHFQHALHQAAWAPENEMPGLLAQIAQRAQTQAQVLERVRAMAPEEAQEGLKLAQQICQREHEAAMAALGDPQTFRFRYQQREGMPDEVEPPTPPTIVPPGGQEGQQGTGWPDQTPVATPQGDPDRDQQRDQERDQQRDQERDQQQEQQPEQQDQQQEQQREQQREQQQDQQREQQHEQQTQQQDQQQDQQREQQRDQDREQQQDQQREQQQEQQPQQQEQQQDQQREQQQQQEQQQEQQREQSSTSDSGGGSGGGEKQGK
ncbi:MAG: hypothetical protein GTN71_19050 [Anaerolineae bacterium]|nr:hypothetical protein [Anaerolineae bacterium]